MMARAWAMSEADGAFPVMVCACSVTEVPPARSRPSWTLKSCRQWPGVNASLPTIASSITMMISASAASARPGLEVVFFGGATSPLSLARPGRCHLLPAVAAVPRLDAALGLALIRGCRGAAVGALVAGLPRRLVTVIVGGFVIGRLVGGFVIGRLVTGIGLTVVLGCIAGRVIGCVVVVGRLVFVRDDLGDGPLEVADLDSRGDLQDHVVPVHVDDGRVHPGRCAHARAGRHRALLLLHLALPVALRP